MKLSNRDYVNQFNRGCNKTKIFLKLVDNSHVELDFRKVCVRCGLRMLLSFSFSFQSRAANQAPEFKMSIQESYLLKTYFNVNPAVSV